MEFAKWLDKSGAEILQNTNIHSKLWENLRRHKPDNFVECNVKDKVGDNE